ncbi:MAG: PHP domain-containing protein [Bacteroidota bacterium]
MKISIKKYNYLISILLIIIISFLFHYPIQILDALTLEPVSDYNIKISVWRIAFEPFLGLLLFFRRGLYTTDEIYFVLRWVIIIFFVYILVRFFVKENRSNKKKYLITQFINLPLVVGLWFTFFVMILFIPLPNNTIINNSSDEILVTTHSHSQFSHDGIIRQKSLWKWHKNNGFDAFFITDHNTHDRTIDFVQAQRNSKFPIEPLVMAGEEFSGSNHFSLLGLKRKFNTHGYTDSQIIDSVRAHKGAIIVNHWFDNENKSLEYYRDLGVDGFEIENSATDLYYNRELYQRIKDFCISNSLIMNGGLDFHGYGNACTIWNAMKIPGWHKLDPVSKEEAILEIIRSKDQSKLRILMYNDRPYYNKDNLFWIPIKTFFNYFRTLSTIQVMWWIIWILIFTLTKKIISSKKGLKKRLSLNKVIPVISVFSALMMLILGSFYFSEIKNVVGSQNDIYEEYSTLLLYIGSSFLIYSVIVAYFRNLKKEA